MWMTEYIREIQKRFITEYGFAENPKKPGLPFDVPDGEYPMIINNRLDKIRIENGKISCCNFSNE